MSDLTFLGGASASADGGIAARRHPLALLALLATAPGHTLSRGRLVGLLWPDAPEKTARNRLTSAVWEVRSALDEAVLLSIGDELRFDPRQVCCDVCAFETALAAGRQHEAVTLYTGPFLDGFHLGGSAPFEHHVDRVRDRLRRAWQAALEDLAREAEARGRADSAARWWRQRATDDPWDSRVARSLMEALEAAGNRAEAMRIAEAHAALLRAEFDAQPPDDFNAVATRIRDRATAPVTHPAPTDPRAVAVLPFGSTEADGEAALFAAGLHEDLLTELSRVPDLTVISRMSVLRFGAADRPLPTIAQALGVAHIVEGTVRSSRGRVRLNVQLIDAQNGAIRWVERYDRALSADAIFDIQIELATRLANTLRAELSRDARATTPAADLETYRLYTLGRGLLDQRTRHEVARAIEYFARAIERDPRHALAHAGLADALSLLEFYDYDVPSADDPLEVARRAVRLGPELGQTHASLGIILSIRHQWAEALHALQEAVRLAPGYAEAHTWLGWVHLLRGAPAEALGPARRAVELDPLAPAFRVYLAEALLATGDLDRALAEAARARELQPGYGLAHFLEGLVLLHADRDDEAGRALERALERAPPHGTPRHAEVHALQAILHIRAGDGAAAGERLERIRTAGHAFSEGVVLAALGRIDDAFVAFQQVSEWSSFATDHMRYFLPDALGPIRTDARHAELLCALERGS